MEDKRREDKEFLKAVEKAARKGAMSGIRRNSIISTVLTIAVVVGAFFYFTNLIGNAFHIKNIFARETAVEGHDMTIDNYGIFGYTVADFADAVLGDSEKLNKIEVYKQEISDASTITNAGLGKFKVFSKTKLITYHGTATYTVDLRKLNKNDFELDETNHVITITIPRTIREDINIPADQIEFGDTEKGVLAFGDVKLTPEEQSDVEKEARAHMVEKLKAENIRAIADEFAVKAVWEMYQPIIASVSPGYTLVVKVKAQ